MKVAALFPGQGSQVVGMGNAFFKRGGKSAELFAEADRALGWNLSELCFSGPIEKLTLTQNAQPAILTTSLACFEEAGVKVVAAAGHSLGEYTALVVAGVLNFTDAVQLVHKRGRYMQEAVQPGLGKMVAVMGPSEEEIATVLGGVESGVAEIANLNCPGQTVVAGDVAGIERFSELMKAAGGKIIPLNVSAPFHCSLMKPAADNLARDLDAISLAEPNIPVYANVTAKQIKSAAEARELLKQQVCSSVRWTESVQNLIAEQAIERLVEFGPGAVLSKLVKRINKAIVTSEVADPDSLAKYQD